MEWHGGKRDVFLYDRPVLNSANEGDPNALSHINERTYENSGYQHGQNHHRMLNWRRGWLNIFNVGRFDL